MHLPVIFTRPTAKKGLAGRGLEFSKSVVEIADFPVYAIGGITAARMPEILQAGAARWMYDVWFYENDTVIMLFIVLFYLRHLRKLF